MAATEAFFAGAARSAFVIAASFVATLSILTRFERDVKNVTMTSKSGQ
jgi:hypothetical protein